MVELGFPKLPPERLDNYHLVTARHVPERKLKLTNIKEYPLALCWQNEWLTKILLVRSLVGIKPSLRVKLSRTF
jgi:hypothetical protein